MCAALPTWWRPFGRLSPEAVATGTSTSPSPSSVTAESAHQPRLITNPLDLVGASKIWVILASRIPLPGSHRCTRTHRHLDGVGGHLHRGVCRDQLRRRAWRDYDMPASRRRARHRGKVARAESTAAAMSASGNQAWWSMILRPNAVRLVGVGHRVVERRLRDPDGHRGDTQAPESSALNAICRPCPLVANTTLRRDERTVVIGGGGGIACRPSSPPACRVSPSRPSGARKRDAPESPRRCGRTGCRSPPGRR